MCLQAILVRTAIRSYRSSPDPCTVTTDEDVFFNQNLDIIIEAAGHHAIKLYGEKALSSGSHLVILSVGALADIDFYENLQAAAKKYNKQMIIPSAAIAGLDRIAAGVLGEIDEITLITRKPTKSWYGTIAEEKVDLATITEPVASLMVCQKCCKIIPSKCECICRIKYRWNRI